MREVERITKQLRRTFEGRAWHGPAVQEALSGVTAEMACAPSPGGAHNIWQIVLHMTTWKAAVHRWLCGDPVRPAEPADWPPIADTSEAAWKTTLDQLRAAHDNLQAEVSRLPDSRLDEPIVAGMPSAHTTLHGIIQHDLYHTGQISMLKKMHETH